LFRQAFSILGRSLWELWDNIFVLVVANLVWSLALVPAMAALSFIGGWIGIVVTILDLLFLSGPVTLGLYELTLNANRRERLELYVFFQSVRTNYWRGFQVGLLNVIFVVLAFVNLTFYSSLAASNSPLGLAVILWGYVVFIWFTMQFYMWPLGLRMEKFSLLGLLRNSFLATFKYPVLSLVLGFVVGLFFLLSGLISFLPLVIFGISYHALVGNKALNLVLEREQVKQEKSVAGEGENPFAIEAAPLPPPKPAPEPEAKPFTTRNAPQGVLRRSGMEKSGEESSSKL
jgi:hypothetical protein